MAEETTPTPADVPAVQAGSMNYPSPGDYGGLGHSCIISLGYAAQTIADQHRIRAGKTALFWSLAGTAAKHLAERTADPAGEQPKGPATEQELRDALEHVGVALNDWFRERKLGHEQRAAQWRIRQDNSVRRGDGEPWVFAEEMTRRDDAEHLEPIRELMRLADRVLDRK